MSAKITGTIKEVGHVQTFDRGFTKRVLLVETDEKYPQTIPIEFVKDKGDQLDNYKEGDAVEVDINIRGSEYNGRHYVNISGWRMSLCVSSEPQAIPPMGKSLMNIPHSMVQSGYPGGWGTPK